MKYSIIIVAYKAGEQLARCLTSLAQHLPAEERSAEIVLVDNSPTKEEMHAAVSKDLFNDLLLRYRRVIHVWDGVNRGFAEGCNEGVRHAQGQYFFFVNPDTVVFPGWADRMLGHLRPGVGAVGPISNFVAGYQRMDFHMKPMEGNWEQAARLAAKGLNRRGVATKLLIGFFLLVPRDVWERVGGMDPLLFLGCDDLDLSLRLRGMGYELIIASDVFVYHEGHASFYAMGEESMALTRKSEKIFLEKLRSIYGENVPTSTELWDCEILPTRQAERMTLSVCMIVRDEGENLKELLPQLWFADEIIVVDTGSADHHTENVLVLGNNFVNPDGQIFEHTNITRRMYEFPWIDDFSAARNFALSKCTKDWVLWLDADDRITEHNGNLIRAALDYPGPLTAEKKCHFAFKLRDHGPSQNGNSLLNDQPRLFPRLPGLEWEGRVHEGYAAQADRMGLQLTETNIEVDHFGYTDPVLFARKMERNMRLLNMEKDSPLKLYHIGKTFAAQGNLSAARETMVKCLSTQWEEPLLPSLVHQIRYLIALYIYKEKNYAHHDMDEYLVGNQKPDALFLAAERYCTMGNIAQAKEFYTYYLGFQKPMMDFYGTDYMTFSQAAKMRLEIIADLETINHA